MVQLALMGNCMELVSTRSGFSSDSFPRSRVFILHVYSVCKMEYSAELCFPNFPCLSVDTVMSYMHCVAHYPYLGGVDESFRGVEKYGSADHDRSREIVARALN
jgi:hypothetical protein